MKLKKIIIPLLVIAIYSCTKDKIVIPQVVMERASEMGKELKEYYNRTNEPDKYNAAKFLIEEGKCRYHYEGDRIQAYTDLLNKVASHPDSQLISMKNIEYKIRRPDTISYDMQQIDVENMIKHIDKIFDFYNMVNWRDSISEKALNEYLLPYTIDKVSFSSWVDYYREQYFVDNDSTYRKQSFRAAVNLIHNWDYANTLGYRVVWGQSAINMPKSSLITHDKLKIGTCQQLALRSCAKLRALGIPASVDFIPTYVNYDIGHEWASAILCDSIFIPMDATATKIGVYRDNTYSVPKVYRQTFSVQNDSHMMSRGICSFLPEFMNNPFITDVTEYYLNTSDVRIDLKNTTIKDEKFAYLTQIASGIPE